LSLAKAAFEFWFEISSELTKIFKPGNLTLSHAHRIAVELPREIHHEVQEEHSISAFY
jgi:hypothetical protein